MPEGAGRLESEPEPVRVFVVWDTSIDGMASILKVLRDDPPAGFAVDALSLDPGVGAIWAANVEPGIERARDVLAVVNKPNANVGHEIGYALGRGKGVRLLVWTRRSALPPWIERPPFHTQLTARAFDVDALAACIAQDKWVRVRGRPKKGEDTLLLCPRLGEGGAIRKRILKQTGWREEDAHGWTLDDLPRQLDGVRRVVWVVMPFLPDDDGYEERDGEENSALSVIAGFAKATGIEVRVWQNKRARTVLDVGLHAIGWDSLEDAERLAAHLVSPPPVKPAAKAARTSAAILADYRAYLRAAHASLVPFFAATSNKLLTEIYVELRIDSKFMRGDDHGKSKWSLRELLSRPGGSRRFVVLADPGAGKSTVCRHLACELAESDDDPLPVFVSLARLASTDGDVFDLAEADLRRSRGETAAKGLAELLRERAKTKEGAGVWLLLDGLDEVPSAESADLRSKRLPAMLKDLRNVAVVITSRAIGYQSLGHSYFEASLLELDEKDGRTLLRNWIGADAERVWADLQTHPRLADLSRNPLMLTLIAKLHIEGQPMPRTRGRLYEEVIDVLLRRGAGLVPQGVKDPTTTAALLAPLSLALHRAEGECWPETFVHERVWDVMQADERYRFKLTTAFGEPEAFLTAVAEQTGILGPLLGKSEPWRYMHRSMREYLTARALLALKDRREFLNAGKRNVQHWGESFALLTGMLPDGERLAMLEKLRQVDDKLALRTLPQVEGIAPADLFAFLAKVQDWSGDYLARVVASWLADGVSKAQAREALWGWVSDERTTEELAFLYYALDCHDIEFDSSAFFAACGRDVARPTIDTVSLSGGEFWMGSPNGMGHGDERPRHRVRLSPFELGEHTITDAQYALFDDKHATKPLKDYPTVRVSWWQAWLFCRWIGGSLPTEAQWEYACRAGSDTQWCFGDDEKQLKDFAWYNANLGGRLHPVGKKAPNAFGLHDMHGNVREWCSDWFGQYPAESAVDPIGPVTGAHRVLRGGSYWDNAGCARSSCRSRWTPWDRSDMIGFRVAFAGGAGRSRS